MSYKPEGYTDLAPYLVVADPEVTLVFCDTVFQGERLRVFHRDDGSIMHAECRIGDTVLMIGGSAGGAGAMLHLYLSDPKAAFDRAVAAGAKVIEPITDKGDGDMRGGVRSACGTSWYLARQVT